jgi:ABC-type glycerol-3-phosphate transport system substrate-binding protein
MNDPNATPDEANLSKVRLTRRQLLIAGTMGPLSAAFLAACNTGTTTSAVPGSQAPASAPPASAAASAAPSAAASAAASAAPSAAASAAPSAAASPSPAAVKEDFSGVTINIACNPSSIVFAEAAAPLWKELTGGTAAPVVVPFAERALKFASAIVSKDPFFDLFFASKDFVAQFGPNLYVDVSKLGVPLDDFVPGTLSQLGREGVTYALPLFADQEFFIYNKSMFADAGISEPPPDTWDALHEFADELNVPPREPCVMPWLPSAGGGTVYWLCYYNPLGQPFLSDDKLEVLFNNDEAVAAWDALDKGFKSKWYGPGGINAASDLDTAKLFNQGLGASQMGLVEFWSQARSQNVADYSATIDPDDVAVATLPTITSGQRGSVLVTEGWGVSAFGKNQEAATSFLAYATGADFQRKLVDGLAGIVVAPNRVSVLSDPDIATKLPPAPILAEQSKGILAWPGTPYDINSIFQLAISNLYKGTWTPVQCRDETVKATNEAIVKYFTA